MSAKWNGGKCKGATHVKAVLRHNDKGTREETIEHSNEFIDKMQIHLNYSILERSYEEKCEFYDSRIEDLKDKSLIRSNTVTMQSIVVYPPDDLPDDKRDEFFQKSATELMNFFGKENTINADVHYDEIHEYIDSETNELKLSKAHLHMGFIPEVEGRLCGKKFSSKTNMIKLNNVLDEMCMREFGISFLSGEGKEKRKKEFKDQKRDSTNKMIKRRDNLKKENTKLTQEKEQIQEDINILKRIYDENKEKFDNLENEIFDLQDENDELQNLLEETKRNLTQIENDFNESLNEKKQEIIRLQKIINSTKEKFTKDMRVIFEYIRNNHPEHIEEARKEILGGYNDKLRNANEEVNRKRDDYDITR